MKIREVLKYFILIAETIHTIGTNIVQHSHNVEKIVKGIAIYNLVLPYGHEMSVPIIEAYIPASAIVNSKKDQLYILNKSTFCKKAS